AAYNTPIGGALFGLEVFLGGLALELYGPIIFATVTATLISRVLLYDHPSYEIPAFHLSSSRELLLYILLGVLVGGVSALFVRTVDPPARIARATPDWLKPLLPLIGLSIVGFAGLYFPQLYGNGYGAVNLALRGMLPLALVLVLPLGKLLLSS